MKYTLKNIVSDRERKAKFSHYIDGTLYYIIVLDSEMYQFPVDVSNKQDVGTTTFTAEFRAITLMRYIRKAIESDNFIYIGKEQI